MLQKSEVSVFNMAQSGSLNIWSDTDVYKPKIFGGTGLCCCYFVGQKLQIWGTTALNDVQLLYLNGSLFLYVSYLYVFIKLKDKLKY